jgi:hypothetical protein
VAPDDSTAVRARVPDYAGLDNPEARRSSDQHIRAWAGELLAAILAERAGLPPAVTDLLNAAILRCEFGDPRLMLAFEEHGAVDQPGAAARLAAADAALVRAVDEAVAAKDPETLAHAVDAVMLALDARNAVADEPGDRP